MADTIWHRHKAKLIELQLTNTSVDPYDESWDLRLEGNTLTLTARDPAGVKTARVVLVRTDGAIRVAEHE